MRSAVAGRDPLFELPKGMMGSGATSKMAGVSCAAEGCQIWRQRNYVQVELL